jgi:hypothetical protein
MEIQNSALRCRIDKLIIIIILLYHSIYYGMKHVNVKKKLSPTIKILSELNDRHAWLKKLTFYKGIEMFIIIPYNDYVNNYNPWNRFITNFKCYFIFLYLLIISHKSKYKFSNKLEITLFTKRCSYKM